MQRTGEGGGGEMRRKYVKLHFYVSACNLSLPNYKFRPNCLIRYARWRGAVGGSLKILIRILRSINWELIIFILEIIVAVVSRIIRFKGKFDSQQYTIYINLHLISVRRFSSLSTDWKFVSSDKNPPLYKNRKPKLLKINFPI